MVLVVVEIVPHPAAVYVYTVSFKSDPDDIEGSVHASASDVGEAPAADGFDGAPGTLVSVWTVSVPLCADSVPPVHDATAKQYDVKGASPVTVYADAAPPVESCVFSVPHVRPTNTVSFTIVPALCVHASATVVWPVEVCPSPVGAPGVAYVVAVTQAVCADAPVAFQSWTVTPYCVPAVSPDAVNAVWPVPRLVVVGAPAHEPPDVT